MEKIKNNLIEKTKSKEILYQGKFLKLESDVVILPNNDTSERVYINHPGAVAILVVDSENNIILEEQYRHPLKKVILEIPAGKLEGAEDIFLAAKRELSEETGLIANELEYLGETYPCAGYSNETIHLFLVTNYEVGKQHLDEEEFINVLKVPFLKVKEMIKNGDIKDSKTIHAIYLYEMLYTNKVK